MKDTPNPIKEEGYFHFVMSNGKNHKSSPTIAFFADWLKLGYIKKTYNGKF